MQGRGGSGGGEDLRWMGGMGGQGGARQQRVVEEAEDGRGTRGRRMTRRGRGGGKKYVIGNTIRPYYDLTVIHLHHRRFVLQPDGVVLYTITAGSHYDSGDGNYDRQSN